MHVHCRPVESDLGGMDFLINIFCYVLLSIDKWQPIYKKKGTVTILKGEKNVFRSAT